MYPTPYFPEDIYLATQSRSAIVREEQQNLIPGHASRRKARQTRPTSLKSRLGAFYVKVTLAVLILIVGLNTAFLVDELHYTMSGASSGPHGQQSAVLAIPIPMGIVMLLVTLMVVPLIAACFGTWATRGLIQRVQELVHATRLVARGEYHQRVVVTDQDEIGQLAQYFNDMAEQLAISVAQQRALAEQTARLAERTRIAREVHDAIAQDLFSVSVLTAGIQTALPADSPVQPQLAVLMHTAREMRQGMRALLLELRPTWSDQVSLENGLQGLAAAYTTRLGIEVTATVEPVSLAPEQEASLLRIVQEAVSNAARHGRANRITIAVQPQAEAVELCIADDGSGFDLERSHGGYGLGLLLMHERMQEAGGVLQIHTAPGEGTRVIARFHREEDQ
jgi:two-component system, NarL family, sensor histidine kinase LiaS